DAHSVKVMSRKVVTKPRCGSALALCGLQLEQRFHHLLWRGLRQFVHPLLAPVSTADRPLVVRLFEDGAPAAAASHFHPASRICSPRSRSTMERTSSPK